MIIFKSCFAADPVGAGTVETYLYVFMCVCVLVLLTRYGKTNVTNHIHAMHIYLLILLLTHCDCCAILHRFGGGDADY